MQALRHALAPPSGELSPKVTERGSMAGRPTLAPKVRRTFNNMSPFPGKGLGGWGAAGKPSPSALRAATSPAGRGKNAPMQTLRHALAPPSGELSPKVTERAEQWHRPCTFLPRGQM